MTTELTTTSAPTATDAPPTITARRRLGQGERRLVAWSVGSTVAVGLLLVVAHNARHRAVAARIQNSAAHAATSVAPLFGWHHWLLVEQVGLVWMLVQLVPAFVVGWRRYPKHPVLLMVIVCTLLIWQDPVMNWAPYAVYNPHLWHWPATWGLVSVSPSVEPFVVVGYVAFYLAPFFPAIWVLRRLQRRRPPTSFVWRHPLVSLAVLIYLIGFVYDAVQEVIMVRTQMYIYSQVIPFGSVFTGKYYQFPLLWESSLVTTVMIPAGVLLYRDDTGRTVAEKLANRVRGFRARPALGTFVVMFAIINACYLGLYGGGFAIIRGSGAATSVACPYPFPSVKVYDPQGFYAQAGQPGPYYGGIMDGWETGQSGRPNVATSTTGRCAPKSS